MIDWILHRPPHTTHPSEMRVAEKLKGLAGSQHSWTVIWGYYYQDSGGTQREGDFLILGPAGGLLVLEVKSSLPRHFPETGHWEGSHGGDPIAQLNAEWKGVIQGISAKGHPPFVAKALCVPGIDAPADVDHVQGFPRNMLVTGNDLGNWLDTWLRIFGNRVENSVNPLQRRAVLEVFGRGSLPEEKRAFIDHTEQLFERQFTSHFALLEQLSDNRQLLIRGGTGTGKTWHALESAFRQADHDGGRRVLFLTYNKALTSRLRKVVALRQLERGEVIIYGWEELFLELCSLAGTPATMPHPRSRMEAYRKFYEADLPRLVLEISRQPELRKTWPTFDALVVDEGQDHDTAWHPESGSLPGESGGWWHIYQALLKEGSSARAAIFYDTAQRPPFRAMDRFDPMSLAAAWSQPAHVRLQPAVRYTRPIWQFLRDHPSAATMGMIDALGHGDHLPEGPDVEVHALPEGAGASDLVESILTRWAKSGFCKPSDVLILHAQSDITRSPLGDRRVLGSHNLRECTEEEEAPNTIRHTSIHKAKGLDAKAVIVIGLAAHADLESDFDHYSWFMAVSRARQLLAVVA